MMALEILFWDLRMQGFGSMSHDRNLKNSARSALDVRGELAHAYELPGCMPPLLYSRRASAVSIKW